MLVAAVVYGYAGSQALLRDRLAAAMHSLNHERATVDEDLAYIEANQAEYEALLVRGLVAEQDRLAAAWLLEQLRDAIACMSSATVSARSAKRRSVRDDWRG